MIFLRYLTCIFVIGISDLSFAVDVYPTDQFSIHKLCIKDPWNARNTSPAYHPDTYSWPCYYNYGIVHIPTYESEMKTLTDQITSLQAQLAALQAQLLQQTTTNSQVVSLELLGINSQTSLIAFGFGFVVVITFWSIGFIATIIRAAGNLIR